MQGQEKHHVLYLSRTRPYIYWCNPCISMNRDEGQNAVSHSSAATSHNFFACEFEHCKHKSTISSASAANEPARAAISSAPMTTDPARDFEHLCGHRASPSGHFKRQETASHQIAVCCWGRLAINKLRKLAKAPKRANHLKEPMHLKGCITANSGVCWGRLAINKLRNLAKAPKLANHLKEPIHVKYMRE